MSTTPETTMYLDIKNNDTASYSNDEVWVSITNGTVYLDFSTGELVNYEKNIPGTTSMQLSELTLPIAVPAIQSARIYFFIGTKDDVSCNIASSGPSTSKPVPSQPQLSQNLYFDKLEFDTHLAGTYNIDQSNVDMYGFSFTFDITPPGGTQPVDTRGISAKRSTVISAFQALADDATSDAGNVQIFKNLLAAKGSDIIRIIAPTSAAYSDCTPSAPTPTTEQTWGGRVSHFFDDYIKNECFKPNREFSFYDKNLVQRYGTVNSTGDKMYIWNDSKYSIPYKINGDNRNYINIPVSKFPDPFSGSNAPSFWHTYQGTNSEVDWGFVVASPPQTLTPFSDTNDAWGWVLETDDPAVMAIGISICRGVMHYDDGTKWKDESYYYNQNGKTASSSNFPIYYWAQILHNLGDGDNIYALAYDDVYGHSSDVKFDSGATVTVTIHSLEDVSS